MAKTKNDGQFDMGEIKILKEHMKHLREIHAKRNTMNHEFEDMYQMRWDEEDRVMRQDENMKITKSPDPRNRVKGAVRLMVASDPEFSVPYNENNTALQGKAEKLEKAAKVMWKQGSRLHGAPMHYDMILSGFLFGEVHTAISSTADLLEQAEGSSPAAMKRAERASELSPYMLETWHPNMGYPEWDKFGLAVFYRRTKVLSGELLDTYGESAEKVLGSKNRYSHHTMDLFYDIDNVTVLLDGNDQPIKHEAHGLPFIPIQATIAEGSRLFEKTEDRRESFLFALAESGLWRRSNLSLTVLYYLINAIGSNPLFVYVRSNPDKELEVDFTRAGGHITLDIGESYTPLAKQVIDPSILEGLRIAEQKTDESTIYGQTLGEPLAQANATFSLTSLLSQAGRLPLIMPQRMLSFGIAECMRMMFEWQKHDKVTYEDKYTEDMVKLEHKDIPDQFELKAKLEVDLPQDKFQMATIASILNDRNNPIMSKRWVREELLNEGQSDAMSKEIFDERAEEALANQAFIAMGPQPVQDQAREAAQGGGPGQPQGGAGVVDQALEQTIEDQLAQGVRPPEEMMKALGQSNPAKMDELRERYARQGGQ